MKLFIKINPELCQGSIAILSGKNIQSEKKQMKTNFF